MQYVLVLNVAYQPLSVVDMEKAVTLVATGKADVVHAREGVFRSQHLEIPVPSVIKIHRNVKPMRGETIPVSRKALFARDDYTCQYCGAYGDEVEHVYPRSRGGKNTWTNLVTACRECNALKADRTPEEAGMELMNQPFAPTRSFMLMARGNDDWRVYLQ